jgi:hypothetical protein
VSMVDAMFYLSRNLNELAHMPWADEAWDEITHATESIERMVDRRAAAQFAGRCEVCKRDLYATPGDEMVKCRPCDMTYPMSKMRQEMLDALDDRLVRASEAAHILPGLGTTVSRKDIDRWAFRGLITPHGRDERGRPLYRVSEVRTVANQSERRPRAAS